MRADERRPGRGAPVLARVTLFAVVTIAGCTQYLGPTRTADDYQLKATSTAESVLSAVRTAELVVDAVEEDDAFARYVAVALADAEGAASGAASTFDALQPPGDGSDALRDELDPLLGDATDILAELRISARRGDLQDLPVLAAPLDGIATELEAFAARHG